MRGSSRLALLEARVRALEKAIGRPLHAEHYPIFAMENNATGPSPNAETSALQEKISALERLLAERQDELDRKQSELAEISGLRKELEITLAAREERLARKDRELEQRHARIASLAQELEQRRGLITNLGQQLEKKNVQLDGYANSLEEADKKIADLEKTLTENKAALLSCQRGQTEAIMKIERLQSSLDKSNDQYGQATELLAQRQNQLKAVTRAYEELKELSLPDQEMLAALWGAVENLSPESRELLEKYYVLSSLYTFLPGIGLFGRIEQFWDSCARLAREGKLPNDIPTILTTLVYLYNSAMPDSRAAIIPVDIGSAYDYSCEDRLGASGAIVSRCVLPGLVRPNGEISKKSLVVLK